MTGPRQPRVAILYAHAGSKGHKVLAENYCELLRSAGMKTFAVDVLALDNRQRFSGYAAIYLWLLRRMPWLWRWLYQNWHRIPGTNWLRLQILPKRFRQTHKLLLTSAPTIVLSTHPVATAVVDYLKRSGQLQASLWVAISDWHIQPFWLFPNVDCYLVPTHAQQTDIERIGISRSKIIVSGMLLSKAYYEHVSRECAREYLRVSPSTPIIVAMGGGLGWGLERVIEGLKKLEVRLIVIAGSQERQMQIQSHLQGHECSQIIEVLGYVDPLPYLVAADLIVTKPGGLSTAEVIHLRKPVILAEAMPGHEEENCRVLSKLGLYCATSSDELLHHAKLVLDNRNIERTPLRVESICCDDTPKLVLKNIGDAISSLL